MTEGVCSSGDDHCCHLGGFGVCPFVERNVAGRRWSCILFRELGDWDAVHTDARYLRTVRPFWAAWRPAINCGDWPEPGEHCATCGGDG